MADEVDWVEGQTAPETFYLEKADSTGAIVPEDLTSLATPTLILYDRTGALVTATGAVAVATPATGKLSVTLPSGATAALSTFDARIKVVYGDATFRYFPQGPAMRWYVRR